MSYDSLRTGNDKFPFQPLLYSLSHRLTIAKQCTVHSDRIVVLLSYYFLYCYAPGFFYVTIPCLSLVNEFLYIVTHSSFPFVIPKVKFEKFSLSM